MLAAHLTVTSFPAYTALQIVIVSFTDYTQLFRVRLGDHFFGLTIYEN